MNAFFHSLTGVGIGCAMAPEVAEGTALKKGCAAAVAFSLAVLSHGILDGLKHLYPFRAETDLFLSLVLIGGWLLWVKSPYRWFFALAIFGSLLPDILDHGTDLLNCAFRWHLPTHPKWFPWHQAEGSGSLYNGKGRLYSLTNHVIVLSFNAAAILFNARKWVQPLTFRLYGPIRRPRWIKLTALGLLVVFLQGCQYDPYADSFTTHRPKSGDISGDYVLEEQTLTMAGMDFLKGKTCHIRIRSNGTFKAENLPPLDLIDKYAENDQNNGGEDDGTAKWNFNRLPGLLCQPVNISGNWQITTTGDLDLGWLGGKTCWGVEIRTSNGPFSALNLTGNKHPDGLIYTFSDPDLAMVLVFKKVQP